MEMTVKEASRHIESLKELKKDLNTLHRQIFQLQEDVPITKTVVCDSPIIDAIAYLSDYENVLVNAIDNAKILL